LTLPKKYAIVTAVSALRSRAGINMTKDQDQMVTMLLIKHGGFANLVDLWLYSDKTLSSDELEAVGKFLEDDRKTKPHDATLNSSDEYPFITLKLLINSRNDD